MISGQTWSKFSKKIKFDVNYEKYCFVRVLTLFDLWSNLGLTRGILVILAKKGTQVHWCPNGLCHVILDVLTAPWRKKMIFLDFPWSGTQIEGGQNTVSTATHNNENLYPPPFLKFNNLSLKQHSSL